MAYQSWSVVFGEQPSAAKWNILGTNDASFNDGTGITALSHAVTAVANPYKFSAYRNAAANTGNGAFAQVVFDTELYDTNDNFASGTYTAPVTGYYFFTSSINQNTGTTLIISIYKNGSEHFRGNHFNTIANAYGASVSALVSLSASDTVDVRAFGNAANALNVGSQALCYFQGFLVSRT